MKTVTWKVVVEKGARTPYWDRSILPGAFGRVNRYFAVNYVQRGGPTDITVFITKNGKYTNGQPWAAWTSSNWRTIYCWGGFQWQNLAQPISVFTHELGHIHARTTRHGTDRDVMGPFIRDIYRNFTINDYNWFQSLGIRPATQVPRAYDEPNYWYPKAADFFEPDLQEFKATALTCGHGNWLDNIRSYMTRTVMVEQ